MRLLQLSVRQLNLLKLFLDGLRILFVLLLLVSQLEKHRLDVIVFLLVLVGSRLHVLDLGLQLADLLAQASAICAGNVALGLKPLDLSLALRRLLLLRHKHHLHVLFLGLEGLYQVLLLPSMHVILLSHSLITIEALVIVLTWTTFATALEPLVFALKLLIVAHKSMELCLCTLKVAELVDKVRVHRLFELFGALEHLDKPVAVEV